MKRSSTQFLLAALGMSVLMLALGRIGDWNSHIPLFLVLYFCAFAAYGIAARLTLKNAFDSVPRISAWIFAIAVVIRLAVFFQEPSISEDFYRYVWDGRVQIAGFGPYDHAPQEPEVQSLRDGNYERMHQKEYKSPYPAAAELLYRLLAYTYPNLLLYKFGILAFDLLLIEVLRRLLAKASLHPANLLLYAWHPLPVIEFAGSAHMDIMGIALLAVSILMLESSHKALSGAFFSAAILTKLLPIFAFPWLVRKGGWKFVVAAAVVGIALLSIYYTPDLRMKNGLMVYYRIWRYNDSLFGVMYKWFGGAEPARNWGLFFVILITAFCYAASYPIYRSIWIIFAAFILFSPVVHPWYVCWVIPFLAFYPNKTWIFFTGWVAIAYLIRYLYPGGNWPDLLWLKLVVYGPLYGLLAVDLWRWGIGKSQAGRDSSAVKTSA
ncbi:MAG TPA: hypothetical protein VFG11_02940 [Acidobacteriota bacterium]|nr:hypothetical protein [Acidobacteriota bacterium]